MGRIRELEGFEKRKEIVNTIFRFAGAAFVIVMLIWYCMHPDYYDGESLESLFTAKRTYAMIISATLLVMLCVVPNRLPDKINRILGTLWGIAVPFAVYFSLWYMNMKKYHIELAKLNPYALVFTFWFLFLVLIILLVITGSIRVSAIVLAAAVGVLGIANRFVIAFRGMAISGSDLFSLGTAMTVASGYTYEIVWDIFIEFYLTAAIIIISCKIRRFRIFGWKLRTIFLCVWLVFAGMFYHICCGTSFLEDHDIRTWGYTHQLRYKNYDMLFTTLLTCFYMIADKPEGYSLDKVEEIAEEYIREEEEASGDAGTDSTGQEGEASVQPDIIVIMNESLADYENIGQGIDFSEDPLEFLHSLEENTIKGTAYASIFGANTPNSEYEFLTGNTMGFLPATSVGFNHFVRGQMPSLASELKTTGYDTLAMHPYRGTNYRRHIVYPQIGFDNYYDRTTFFGAKYIRQYISDESLFRRIIKEYEKHKTNSDTPFFSYNVTVQNHGGYTRNNTDNLDQSILALTPGIDIMEMRQYANLVNASDDAYKMLIEYFSEREEPVVIITFGDHQANLGDKTYNYLVGNEEELSPEELMEKYKIPFWAWANYDIEEETIEKTSLNYLYSILAKRLNLPMTGYQNYLYDLSDEIPVLTAGGYWTKDGEFYELNDEASPYFEKINAYNILEYNYIFGKKNRCMELFALQE